MLRPGALRGVSGVAECPRSQHQRPLRSRRSRRETRPSAREAYARV